ncbi:MAG: cadherin-like beta sandwich domain-containing protein, partial [Akkermansiaceae bacterium]|nr:cadherin-like beta sandwich domain-containing protein [Akkermansiaceae bacterium]
MISERLPMHSKRRTFGILHLLTALVMTSFAHAANYYVDTATQFNAKVDKNGASFATLSSDDRVYLKGGVWGGLIVTLNGSMSDALAQSNPAVIYACDTNYNPTVGGVTVAGLSQIRLKGSGIVFAGVTFGPTSGMYKRGNYTDYGGNDASAYIIQMEGLSRYMTVSHVKFDYCGRDNTEVNNDHYGSWVTMNGFHHTLQYCEIQGRDFNPNDINQPDPLLRTSIRQATIVIYKEASDVTDWGYHTVRYNYFGERKTPLSVDGEPGGRCYTPVDGSLAADMTNGYETVRVGNSSFTSVDFNTTVEYNTFYHSIYAVDGGVSDNNSEPEAISNKSRKNTYCYNTILNNYGQLCLRQGDYCVVQGNYFLAGGAYDANGNIVFTEPLNDRMGGVRAFGFGHIISNNYFYNIRGSGGLHSALMLGSGVTTTGTLASLNNGDGAAGYETANLTQVMGNTFIDCTYISLDSINGEINPVYGTQFFNNLIYYGSNISGSGIFADTPVALTTRGGQAKGNYVFSSNAAQLGDAVAMLGTTGNTITSTSSKNPLMTAFYDVLTIPSSTSLVNGQAAALPVITDTSLTAPSYNLAGNATTYGALDLRGLSRPATGRDIGDYEREATGVGARPMRRSEVGTVASTYLVKQPATVTLGSLAQVYSGAAISATATTTPSGLTVDFTYDGSASAPTNAGSYAVVGTINSAIYSGSATGTLVISKAAATVTLGSLAQAYSGAAKSATATTTPSGLTVDFTYDGSASAPTNVGSYAVVGTVNSANYSGSATGTLVISKGAATVTLGSLAQAYTGSAISATATTAPSGLTVDFTYDGSASAPTNVGSYAVVGTINSENYSGSSTGTLVISKVPASVVIGGLLYAFDGTVKSASAVTTPSGLAVNFSYTGSPLVVGSYPVVATIVDPIYSGSSSGTLVITSTEPVFTLSGASTWICPANVHSVQVQCWGGGGAGGSAKRGTSSAATGGGGAGGAYAKLNYYAVDPGATYFLSVGDGGISSLVDGASVPGGDTWFNSVNSASSTILAKGGAGGVTAVTTNSDKFGAGGVGSATGSIGDVVFRGGSGANATTNSYGGGGGGSAGTAAIGVTPTANSGLGAVAVTGGGNGGNPNPTSGTSANGSSPTTPPGGGGGGARSASTTARSGGSGAVGKITLTLAVDSAPGPPTNVAATPGNAQAIVSFTPPINDGGVAITSYTVTADPGGATMTGSASPVTMSGLLNGTGYTFTVTATNSIGTSLPSAATATVTPATLPSVTTPSSASVSSSTATLGGNVTNDGGAALSVRGIVYSQTAINSNPQIGGVGVTNVPTSGTTGIFTVNVSALTPGTAYTFAAYATNNQGTGYSSIGSFVTLSSDATLSALSLSAGTLIPVFSTSTYLYNFSVSNEVASTTVTPTATQGGAAISVNGTTVLSGNASSTIPLNVGSNSIVTSVTAQDGVTTHIYTVTVTRLSPVETWRKFYFNIISDSGIAADTANPDGDNL